MPTIPKHPDNHIEQELGKRPKHPKKTHIRWFEWPFTELFLDDVVIWVLGAFA